MQALPAPAGSQVGRELARRLLLASADVPAGGPGARDLITLRADRLLAAGRAGDAAALIGAVGASTRRGTGLDAQAAEAAFLAGQNDQACALVDAAVAQAAGPEGLKATAFCRALIGDAEGAGLAIDMLREDKVDDPAFVTLMAVLLGGKPPKADPKAEAKLWADPTPLRLAMAHAAKVPLPESLYLNTPARLMPALLAADATTAGAKAGRLDVARRAEGLGLIDSNTLGKIYEAADFTDAERAGGMEAARAMTGARQAARLHQIIRAASSPEAAADAVRLALSTSLAPAMRANGTFGTAVRLEGAGLRAITPTASQTTTAPLAIRTLIAAGDVDGALGWYQMLRDAAPGNSVVAFLVLDLWPLVQAADGGRKLPWGVESPARWLRGQAAAGDRFRRAAIAWTLFEWRGWPVNDAAWEPVRAGLSDPGRPAQPELVAEMTAAAAKGESGHALLALVALLGDSAPDRLAIADLKAVLATLDGLGLRAEANALAAEAAIGSGL